MKISKTYSGALLVAGTAIGAGMLGLPIATAEGGFFPALVMYVLCWAFMMGTALLFLEVCRWMPKDSNLVSMSYHLLGKGGKFFSWILYLFLFYSLCVSYVSGGGEFVRVLGNGYLPHSLSCIIFIAVFAPIVYFGTRAVNRINYILMSGLIISYFLFVLVGVGHFDLSTLDHSNWKKIFYGLPIMFASFAFQGVIPTLYTFLDGKEKQMRKALIIGSAIPLLTYILWEFLILGIIPLEGENGLLAARELGQSAIGPLSQFVGSSQVAKIGQFFAFFALTTSFLGVTLGLTDFLADGFQIEKKGGNKLLLAVVVFIPPLLITLTNPGAFLIALTYAGGIGCALLLGLMPILMVWKGRYRLKLMPTKPQLPGGKWLLFLMVLFVVFELGIEFIYDAFR